MIVDDVVIAGAGPAGAIAATILARAGARVLLIDRATFPRAKLCGDTLNPGAVAVLARLGLRSAIAAALPLDGMIVTGLRGVRVQARYGAVSGCAIARTDLDLALLVAAADAGARVEHGTLVEGPLVDCGSKAEVRGVLVRGAQGTSLRIPARIVIAADGRYSRVARPLGLSRAARRRRRWAIGGYFENVGGMTAFGEMHVRAHHYIGVAPLPNHLANACVVTAAPRGRSPRDVLLSALREDAELRDRFVEARLVTEPVCLGPLGVDSDVPGTMGLLLAGDAAGFVDPMTGDGLRFAFRGGELAAHEALRALEHGTAGAHARLRSARRREFARKWRFNRTMRWLVAHPSSVRVAGYGAAIAPRLLQHAIRYAGDLYAA